ncbi:hypothetical protein G4B88_003079 [Cannabis sativa]|uniref:Myb/SANT-like domain-containing protein n=1 Tax=Cannabis sativa TaxID=3483 RepID=A0A7J6H209_CANSA|nr:hypothetical protein G4B88_003079 [Cannabis sativa]
MYRMTSNSNVDQRGRESMLEAKLLGSNLKASPHIESRIKTLKGKYSCLAELLLLSGFNWDEVHSTLVCEKSVFDENVKKRKDASSLYGKSFPYYHKLAEIYGRDRAIGANADDDEEEICHDNATGVEFGVDDNINDGGDDEKIDEFDGISNTQQPTNMCRRRSTESTTNNQKSGKNKKSKVINSISTNIGALAESVSEIVLKLQGLTDALSDKNVIEMQDNLYTKISKIEGLTIMQCIRATNILVKEPALMRVFYAISYEMKMQYIMNLL